VGREDFVAHEEIVGSKLGWNGAVVERGWVGAGWASGVDSPDLG
jgi:hypothetical protein